MARSGEASESAAGVRRRGLGGRVGAVLLVGLAIGAAGAAAVHDVETRRRVARERAAADLGARAETVRRLFVSERMRLEAELARLQTELRGQGVWPGLAERLDEQGRLDTRDAGGRRLHGLLSQALEADDRLAGLDLVVAGAEGLAMLRFPPGAEETLPSEAAGDPARLREGVAKSLWYGDDVSRAVAANGRAIVRGTVGFERVQDVERALLSLAIGLHAPGELVQGALRARVDLGRIASDLERLALGDDRLVVVTLDGRRLGATGQLPGSEPDPQLAALAARAGGPLEAGALLEVDARLVHVMRLAAGDESGPPLLVLQETAAPAPGLALWLETPWPIVLAALAVVSVLTCGLLLRAPRGVASEAPSDAAEEDDDLEVRRERFVLRDWLADVRACLEREAAQRGLLLDLRCERSLPEELVQDPAWLGGLLIALGREALDTTPGEGVALEVVEEDGHALCFELAAGDARLAPLAGLSELAARIGARIESRSGGHLAVVLEGALA